MVSEQGQDGRQHDLFVPIEIWGKKAEQAAELEPGQWILFQGKLAKRKKADQWETIVSSFELMPLAPPVASMTGSPHGRGGDDA